MEGLSCRFKLTGGKFQLTQGVEKSKDDVWFYCVFDKVRTYLSDYGGNFPLLVQRPTSMLIQNKVFIFGNLQKGIEKYVNNVAVKWLDIGYAPKDRKSYILVVSFLTKDNSNNPQEGVTFV